MQKARYDNHISANRETVNLQTVSLKGVASTSGIAELSLQDEGVLFREVEDGWGLDGGHCVLGFADRDNTALRFDGAGLKDRWNGVGGKAEPFAHGDFAVDRLPIRLSFHQSFLG